MKLLEWEDANPHNAKVELEQLIGLTITGYGYVNGDICDFLVLTVEKDGRPITTCLLYTSPSPRDATLSRMPSSA